MTTTAEPEVSHDALRRTHWQDFNVLSGPARAHIHEAQYFYSGDNDNVDWWTGAGPHFVALIEAATELARRAEEFEKTVRSVTSDLKAED